MELTEALTTTFACRDFTDEPVGDEVLRRILDVARFAPSGGNRQGGHVTVVRDAGIRGRLVRLADPPAHVYAAQRDAGETPFSSVHRSAVDGAAVQAANPGRSWFAWIDSAPVVLVVTVDLAEVASVDKDLDRVGLVTGASLYPLAWSILLAARGAGHGGVITTRVVPAEAAARPLLSLPDTHAVAALIPLGRPVRQLTRLRRRAVDEFVTVDRYDGPPLSG